MRHLPEEVRLLFQSKGIETEQALTLLKTDMAREETYCDAYTVVTREGIASLFCIEAVQEREGASFFSRNKTEKVLRQLDYFYLPLSEIEELKVEEQISVLRLVVKRTDGQEEIVLWASNACRKRLFAFSEGFERFRKEGVFPKREKPDREECPRCHTPYSSDRRICKKCFSKKSLILKIMPFFLRYKWRMFAILCTFGLLSGVNVVTPYFSTKVLYDEVLSPTSAWYGKILLLVLVIASVELTGAVIRMIHSIVVAKVSAFVTYDLKKTIFSSFERLSYSFFTSRHTGRLITQINSDAETLYWFFCDGIPYFLTNVLQIIGVLIVMTGTNPLLTLVVVVPIPFLFFGYYAVMKMFRRLHAENHTHRSRFNSVLSDVLNGMRIVKAFSREETEIRRFDEKSRDVARSGLTISLRNQTIFPLFNLGIRLTAYVVWGVGGYLVLQEGVTPGSGIQYGELALFVSYLSMLYNPLNYFANFFSQMAGSLNAMQRLFEILETEAEVQESKNPVEPETIRGRVEFSHVNFSYAPGKKTIDDVSFTVEAGKTLGIVGHTGAGKSTLANLLTRLYDVDGGNITVDGIDLKDLSFATLRKNIAIVSQETYLFRGSIMDNIRYAKPEATREEVLFAAKAAGCHEFIMTFPDGYETWVGYDKKSLSGGEKQRISIARAILKDPAILILDEATAAMDTKTERRIQKALAAITENRTTITIAHRLSTLKDADSLIVIEDGKVVEHGTHEALLEIEDGVYRKLYRLQMEAMKTIGIEE